MAIGSQSLGNNQSVTRSQGAWDTLSPGLRRDKTQVRVDQSVCYHKHKGPMTQRQADLKLLGDSIGTHLKGKISVLNFIQVNFHTCSGPEELQEREILPLIDERSGMGRDIGKDKDRCVCLPCELAWGSGRNQVSV